uniref:DUF3421 domain-containing protein n=1 Tax=Macrostomum lignano TaxID=282301 RepID=A0A1I8GF13_9PLAT
GADAGKPCWPLSAGSSSVQPADVAEGAAAAAAAAAGGLRVGSDAESAAEQQQEPSDCSTAGAAAGGTVHVQVHLGLAQLLKKQNQLKQRRRKQKTMKLLLWRLRLLLLQLVFWFAKRARSSLTPEPAAACRGTQRSNRRACCLVAARSALCLATNSAKTASSLNASTLLKSPSSSVLTVELAVYFYTSPRAMYSGSAFFSRPATSAFFAADVAADVGADQHLVLRDGVLCTPIGHAGSRAALRQLARHPEAVQLGSDNVAARSSLDSVWRDVTVFGMLPPDADLDALVSGVLHLAHCALPEQRTMSKVKHAGHKGIEICVSWQHAKDGDIPPNAVEAAPGCYVVRAKLDGLWVPGQLSQGCTAASVPNWGTEHSIPEYEVLVRSDIGCYGSGFKWVKEEGGDVPKKALVAGREKNAEPLYIARGEVYGSVCVGKVHKSHRCAYFPYGGTELKGKAYEVLAEAAQNNDDDDSNLPSNKEAGMSGVAASRTRMVSSSSSSSTASNDEAEKKQASSSVPAFQEENDTEARNEEAGDRDEEEEGEEEDAQPVESRINVDFPLIRADLGKEIYFVKMPNFLTVDTRPFDPATYEDALDEEDVVDEEGRHRLRLRVENTIRWRVAKDAEGRELTDEAGQPLRESNAKMVRWSDGSLSLHLGAEIFDVHSMDTTADFNHLFIRQGSGLQGQAVFRRKLVFRPHSTASATHKKITRSLADKSSKQHTVKVLPILSADPERVRQEALRREEEMTRARIRRENIQRRRRERGSGASSGGRLSRSFLESGVGGDDEDEDEEGGASLSAIKRNYRRQSSGGKGSRQQQQQKKRSSQQRGAIYSSTSSSSVSSSSEDNDDADEGKRKKKSGKKVDASDDEDDVGPQQPKRAKKVLSDDEDEQQQDDEEEAGGDSAPAEASGSGAQRKPLPMLVGRFCRPLTIRHLRRFPN